MYQNGGKYTKLPLCKLPNGNKIYEMFEIKLTNIFHCKTLQNLPESDFWFVNIPSGNPVLLDMSNKTSFTFITLVVWVCFLLIVKIASSYPPLDSRLEQLF
jgi:hypothetical protein